MHSRIAPAYRSHFVSRKAPATIKPFLTLDFNNEFKGDSAIDVSGLALMSTFDGFSFGVGGGFDIDWGSASFYVKGEWETFDSSQGDLFDILAGVRFRW